LSRLLSYINICNNPNSPEFPGLNSANINQNSDNMNNYNNNQNNLNYSENSPDSNLINKISKNIYGSWFDNVNCNLSFLQAYFEFETDEIIKKLIALLIVNQIISNFEKKIKNIEKPLIHQLLI